MEGYDERGRGAEGGPGGDPGGAKAMGVYDRPLAGFFADRAELLRKHAGRGKIGRRRDCRNLQGNRTIGWKVGWQRTEQCAGSGECDLPARPVEQREQRDNMRAHTARGWAAYEHNRFHSRLYATRTRRRRW